MCIRDRSHVDYVAGNPYEQVIPDYYLWLDEQVGKALEILDDNTCLLYTSRCV